MKKIYTCYGELELSPRAERCFHYEVDDALVVRVCRSTAQLQECPNCKGIFRHYILLLQPMTLRAMAPGAADTLQVGVPVGGPCRIASVYSVEDVEAVLEFLNQLPVPEGRFDHLRVQAQILHSVGKIREHIGDFHYEALVSLNFWSFPLRAAWKLVWLVVRLALGSVVWTAAWLLRVSRILSMLVRMVPLAFRIIPPLAAGKVVRVCAKVEDAEGLKRVLSRVIRGSAVHIVEAVREAQAAGESTFAIDVVGTRPNDLACRSWHLPPVEPALVVEVRDNWLHVVK